jgi:hypothetical protein
MARIGWMAVIVAVAGLAVAAGASAVSPDVAAMNLQAADVPGAKVVKQHAVTQKGYIAAHFRSFVFSAPNKGPRLVGIESVTALAADPSTVSATVAADQKLVASANRRKAIAASIAKNANVKPKAVTVGPPRSVAGYDQGFAVTIGIAVKGGHVYQTLVELRLDRVFVQLIEGATHPIASGVTSKYAGAIAHHIATELSPVDVSVPTVTGTAQQGQTLTAAPGSWTATDATFAYQWQHCDSAGANCGDVAGATAQTYAVTPTDVGTTLHVVVKATNRFGSASAPSPPSAVVT